MNPLGKEQSTVFETLEKGNFIVPPGGDPGDTDKPLLRSALTFMLPGFVLAALLPGAFGGMELPAFIGALLIAVGAGKLMGGCHWFRGGVVCAVLQTLALALVLVAQTSVPMLLESPIYTTASISATVLCAVTAALLTIGFWKSRRKYTKPMCMLTASVLVSSILSVFFPYYFLLRLLSVIPGVSALVWLLLLARQEAV